MRIQGALLVALFAVRASAQTPPEVQGVAFGDKTTLAWSAASGAGVYEVYRGVLSALPAGIPGRCHGYRVAGTSFPSADVPDAGQGYFYLVTGESAAGVEGTTGVDSHGVTRALLGHCGPLMRNHVFDRTGYGWSEWSRDRMATLGSTAAFVSEQLDPSSISEADNIDLSSRLTAVDPPKTSTDLISRQVVGAVYARRQLAEQAGSFWTNHFNTENRKVAGVFNSSIYPRCTSTGVPPQCDAAYPARGIQEASNLQKREFDTFQSLSFSGTFRQMLEASAKSPAMLIFLDATTNALGAPNENYARELLELHTMGVDGGYTQTDVEQLAKVLTGWSFCKKAPADEANPLAPCITNYWDSTIAGDWVANFVSSKHDCGTKFLFQLTAWEAAIPSTCGNPAAQAAELSTALDAIVVHTSTQQFISKEILQRFVTDTPDQSQIDAMVATWNNPNNPHGIGDVRELLRTALTSPAFLDPDRVGSKIKNPLEHFASAFRTVRGKTDGSTQVFNYLSQAGYLPYLDMVPTGWPETGDQWVNTGNTLVRQNFGIKLASATGTTFGADPLGLLVANGIPTTSGNAEAVVDFFSDVLFAGALTPAERQAAIDFLNTDDTGAVSAYTTTRIKDLVAFLLGYPHFQEQ